MKKRVNLCMSGGRTSAYLTEKVLGLQLDGHFSNIEFIVTFANTGREHEETLRFVNKCDERWSSLYGVSVVWLEAVVHPGRKPCSHRIVSFETASRSGYEEPFEHVVAKYGLPNSQFLHCTRELKENPIISYMESLGEKKGHIKNKEFIPATYETWIGIRADEPKRLGGRKSGKQLKVYPLAGDLVELNGCGSTIDLSCDKQDVLEFWSEMLFNLNIPEHLGNCIDCHKKSFNKLFKCIADVGEKPFRFTAYLDVMYSMVNPEARDDGTFIPRKRFRGYKNTAELIAMFKSSEYNTKDYSDESGGCSESCEPFMIDNEPDIDQN